jgi:hypothetical protein
MKTAKKPAATPRHDTVRLRAQEVELVRQVAAIESRSMCAILTLALKDYVRKQQPALAQRVYGEVA